jgi:putative membrane protein
MRSALTWLAHFGYGGAAGALFSGTQHRFPGGFAVRGAWFGLLVWSGSYLGLLPALGVLKPATAHPIPRNALMIMAHVIWGLFLATIFEVLFSDLWRGNAAFHASPRRHLDVASRRG